MERRLVVGVDGSTESLHALEWAVDEAALHKVPLHILHVSDEKDPSAASDNSDLPLSRVVACRVIAQAADRAHARRPNVRVTTDAMPGEIVPTLLDAAGDASALVLGTRGRGQVTGLLLGSVSLRAASHAHVPVVVFRGPAPGKVRRHRRVAVGVGSSGSGGAAVAFAFREARVHGDRVTAVHAWRTSRTPATVAGGLPHDHLPQDEVLAEKVLDFALGAAADAEPDVPVERVIVEGSARKALLRAASSADLIVLGARRREVLVGPRLGPASHALLQHARCPVVIVPGT